MGITLDYSRERVTRQTMDMLFDLADASGVERKKTAMATGAHINTSEDRAVMHIALRAPSSTQLFVDGADVVPDVHRVLSAVESFSESVRTGKRVRYTSVHKSAAFTLYFCDRLEPREIRLQL